MEIELNLDTRLEDFLNQPKFAGIRDYVIYSPMGYHRHLYGKTLRELSEIGWNAESMLYGLQRLSEVSEDPRFYAPVYEGGEAGENSRVYAAFSENGEAGEDPRKKDVNVLFFPAKVRTGKPFFIIAAGGGYSGVCSIVEGYPVAARLNELGFDAFVLTYRVGGKGVLPKPLEDLSAAVRLILNRAELYGLRDTRYAVAGFSAGGNLTALFGTERHGYAKYGVPRPVALVPVYPVINMNTFSGKTDGDRAFCEIMYGENFTEADVAAHNVDELAAGNYPPSYILCCKDDPVVPWRNSVLLKEKLDALGIPAVLEMCETGGHGFGEGRGTEAEGWIQRAAEFVSQI